jgi:N-terminal domain on NACHT_NTPase and P-loop NTPases
MSIGPEVVGTIATIVQLIDFTCKVCSRINEFQSKTRDVPKTFRQFQLELPLLQTTFQQIQEAIENGHIAENIQKALVPTVEGCKELIEKLNDILGETLPKPEDSWGAVAIKAIVSLQNDSKVRRKMEAIRGYQSSLTFYFAASTSLRREKGIP